MKAIHSLARLSLLYGAFCAAPLSAAIVDDNITANVSLTSQGHFTAIGQSSLDGPVDFLSSLTINDQAREPWTGHPANQWNVMLEDGLFLWDDPSHVSDLGLNFGPGDSAFVWYPQKATFRVGESFYGMSDQNVANYSIALGRFAIAWLSPDAIAIGGNSISSHIAIGESAFSNYTNLAIGTNAYGDGNNSVTIGTYAENWWGVSDTVACGFWARVDNNGSVALGADAQAQGYASTAIGRHSVTEATLATSIAHEGRAQAYASVILGSGNAVDPNQNASSWVATDELLVVGNGEDDVNRSNALVIRKNGNAQFHGNIEVNGVVTVNPVGDIQMADLYD